MYAVKSNSLIHTGRVGDIFATIKNKLMSSQYQQGLEDAATGFLYYYFLSPFFNQYRGQLPPVVIQKIGYAKQAYDYIHDHWGFSYGDMNNPNRTGIIDRQLTQQLGMLPDYYLGLALGLSKSQVQITGLFDSLIGVVKNVVPGGSVVTNAVTTGTNLISSIFSKISQLNPPTTWQMAFPVPDDWKGWTRAQIGKYVSSVNDPLGLTGYDGSSFGAAQLSSAAVPTTAVQQQSATQASAAGSNKWATIIFVGGLVGLLGWNFLRHNK